MFEDQKNTINGDKKANNDENDGMNNMETWQKRVNKQKTTTNHVDGGSPTNMDSTSEDKTIEDSERHWIVIVFRMFLKNLLHLLHFSSAHCQLSTIWKVRP